jgi:glucose-1-phosphate cytidylyltransferase
MKVVILAGGLGTRLAEETGIKPKPMVEVGGKPILWHIMKIYSAYGLNDFVVCCGYKGSAIKEYFASYFLQRSDVCFDLKENKMTILQNNVEPWKVTLVDTGEKTMTGGRIKRIADFIENETFCMTYGDGLSDINIGHLIEFHNKEKALATLTAVQPPGRFGVIDLHEGQTKITSFREKAKNDGAWINGGFFVLKPDIVKYIQGDMTTWEQEPLQRLAKEGKLSAYKHPGFWQPMDTLRDKTYLEELWASGKAPWKVW